jgi:hypothetical protein
MTQSHVRRYVAGFDLHFPIYHKPTVNAFMHLIADIKPDGVILGGDQFDNKEISHHNRRKPLHKREGAYARNTQKFEEDFLKPLEGRVGRKCEKVWIVGNHDYWEHEFIEEHPELEGLLDRPQQLSLDKRGWKVVPLGHAFTLGHLNIIHGEVLSGFGTPGLYPARKAVELYGDNVLAGHTHAPQSYAKVSPVEQTKKHMGWIAPILGDCNPDYLENRPTAWVNGFVVIEMWGRMFNLYPINCFNGEFTYGGQHYCG